MLDAVELRANRVDARPDGWQVRYRVAETCEVCGEPCKRGDLPAGEVAYAGDGHSDYCAALAADRVYATGQPRALPGRARCGVRAADRLPRARVSLLRLPEPFDFELSTERFRAFGPDLANLWVDGGLHRVVGVREMRIEPAPGGADVEPLDRETRRVALTLLGAPFDLEGFYAWAQDDPVLARADRAARRLPAAARARIRSRRLVTSITAQQVSLHAAFAIRNRLIERFGRRVGQAYAFPTAEQLREATHDDLRALGFSNRKAEYVLGLAQEPVDLRRARLAAGRRGQAAARLDPRARRVDGRVVPRQASRASARVAGRRRRARQGGARVLPGRDRSRGGPRALRAVPEPVRPLPAHRG